MDGGRGAGVGGRKRKGGKRIRGRRWRRIRSRVLERDGYRCTSCGRAGRLEVHHVRPVRHGGSNEPENLRTLCRRCHHAIHQARPTAGVRKWASLLLEVRR